MYKRQEYGPTLEAVAECFYRFNKGIIDAIYDIVPSVKPQIAMYEDCLLYTSVSVTAPVCTAQITGLGLYGYKCAIDAVINILK